VRIRAGGDQRWSSLPRSTVINSLGFQRPNLAGYIVAIALLSTRLSYEDNGANVLEKKRVRRKPHPPTMPTAYCLGCRLLLIHFFFGAAFISEVRPPIMVRASSAWKGKCRTDCCPLPFREISTRRLLAQMMACIRFEILSFSS